MEISSGDSLGEKKIATSIAELPPLKEDFVRVVHITEPQYAEEIRGSGLNYEKYGMAMSTARAYGEEKEVEYGSTDPRFNYEGLKAVVFDLKNAEWKLHNDIRMSPGTIPSDRLVGIVDIIRK